MKVSFSREYVNENSMLGLLNSHFVRLMVRPDWFLQLRHDVVTNIFTLENLCGGVDSKTEPLILIQSHVRGECSDVFALRMKLQLVVSRF